MNLRKLQLTINKKKEFECELKKFYKKYHKPLQKGKVCPKEY